jgi:hypothetical protein
MSYSIRVGATLTVDETRMSRSVFVPSMGCSNHQVFQSFFDTHTGHMNETGITSYITMMTNGIAGILIDAQNRGVMGMQQGLDHMKKAFAKAIDDMKAANITHFAVVPQKEDLDPQLN